MWNWTGRRSKWTINTENRLTVEAFTKRFHGSVISSVLTNDVFKTDPFGGILAVVVRFSIESTPTILLPLIHNSMRKSHQLHLKMDRHARGAVRIPASRHLSR